MKFVRPFDLTGFGSSLEMLVLDKSDMKVGVDLVNKPDSPAWAYFSIFLPIKYNLNYGGSWGSLNLNPTTHLPI